jgi:hypothetical protein
MNCRLPQTPRTPAAAATHYFDDVFTRQRRKSLSGTRRNSLARAPSALEATGPTAATRRPPRPPLPATTIITKTATATTRPPPAKSVNLVSTAFTRKTPMRLLARVKVATITLRSMCRSSCSVLRLMRAMSSARRLLLRGMGLGRTGTLDCECGRFESL